VIFTNNMKKFFFLIALLVTVAGFAQKLPPKPNPPKLVNDYINLLTTDQRDALERKLVAYDDSTSTQITVVAVSDLGGADIADFAVALGREWGVGGKEFSNGVVIVVYRSEDNTKRKVFIATGYGMESTVSDITAKQIVDYDIVPNFKANDYYRGLDNGTTAIMKAAAGKYKAPENYRKDKGMSFKTMMLIIFIIFILITVLSSGGGRNGGMMSRRGYSPWIGPTWINTGGGGGFGGFGGGSFGGGGAGGDW
jgi:uncharacterized protein